MRRPLRGFRPHRVLHRLAFAQQVRHAAEVGRLERTALRLDPQALHDQIEDVRTSEVQEVEDLRVLDALDFCSCALALVSGVTKVGGETPNIVLGELLLVHQLRTRDAHQLDADAHEADVLDVGGDVGARPGEADPGLVACGRVRRRCRARNGSGRPSCTTNSPRTMPCVLVLPPRSKPPGFQSAASGWSKLAMIESQVGLFVRNRPFFGDRQAFVRAAGG